MELPQYVIDALLEEAERKALEQRNRELVNKCLRDIRRKVRYVCLLDGGD